MTDITAKGQSGEGHRVWHVPDCFLPSRSVGEHPSHEAFCVLNVSDEEARIELTFYFADREPLYSQVTVDARRNVHFRTDRPGMVGTHLPADVPYGCRLQSSVPVTVQYSRLDAQDGYELMTTSAVPVA
ncbi:sensory rhodopsin transducer [Phytoactinopolyspora endophytica]|uniref:sensory rhodopsin transducer n=1 Tax=Phytoactinopolyspora endophytica TaxID=1642495 RepID=UPI00197C267E|nr:sensory rhodopsin transducer [Phytoactinopolyspora endophytica]